MPAVAVARETHVFYGMVPVGTLVLGSVAAATDVFAHGWWSARRAADAAGLTAAAIVAGLLVVEFVGQTFPIVPSDLQPPVSLNQRVLAAVVGECSTDP
jgi:hypothetical protein